MDETEEVNILCSNLSGLVSLPRRGPATLHRALLTVNFIQSSRLPARRLLSARYIRQHFDTWNSGRRRESGIVMGCVEGERRVWLQRWVHLTAFDSQRATRSWIVCQKALSISRSVNEGVKKGRDFSRAVQAAAEPGQ